MMFIYTYDPNAILVDPLQDITKESILQAYQNIIGHITIRGFKPGLQRLENKASELLQNEMDNNNINWKIVPPENHRINVAERQIRTFKNHFISILSGTDTDSPLRIWDKLVPQECTTINLLRNSHRNSQLSEEAHLNGQFD